MDDDKVRVVLCECYVKLVGAFQQQSDIDPRFVHTLRYAAGVIREGLEAERDRRPLRTTDIMRLIQHIDQAVDEVPLSKLPSRLRDITQLVRDMMAEPEEEE